MTINLQTNKATENGQIIDQITEVLNFEKNEKNISLIKTKSGENIWWDKDKYGEFYWEPTETYQLQLIKSGKSWQLRGWGKIKPLTTKCHRCKREKQNNEYFLTLTCRQHKQIIPTALFLCPNCFCWKCKGEKGTDINWIL